MVIVDLKAGQCLLCASKSRTRLHGVFKGDLLTRSLHLPSRNDGGRPGTFFERQKPEVSKAKPSSKSISFENRRPKRIVQKLLSPYHKPNESRTGLRALELPSLRPRLADNGHLIPIIFERLEALAQEPEGSPFLKSIGVAEFLVRASLRGFEKTIVKSLKGWDTASSSWTAPQILESLRRAYVDNNKAGLDAQLKFAFHGHFANHRFTESDIWNQAKLADLRYPTEWYPATRVVQRTIHLHVGPTNSGKTYHALKRLEQAESGIYAGPLRLLAHEVYSRLNAKGKSCCLITGDERILMDVKEHHMSSCTIEMVPINLDVEVAVVDEIQMIGSMERGWAWTQAVLGLKAQELHLCGEDRAVPLIRELAAATGDKIEIHRYERLSPLRTMSTSLDGDLRSLRKGDCVVAFSRVGIHALKKEIEKITKKRVAVVYGSLPPEIRAQQAKLFNEPDNDYDILVASDAIGMGLNLSIKRIVFESTSRHDGSSFKTLSTSDIKQIAGRAGRYRTAAQAQNDARPEADTSDASAENLKALPTPAPAKNLGLVTSLEKIDLPIIRRAMQSEASPLLTAGIFPPATIVNRFAKYFPQSIPFSYILLRLHELSRMHPRFHLCELRDQIGVADVIQPIKNLTVNDRINFCASPASLRDPGMPSTVEAFARCVANQGGGSLLDIPELKLELLDQEVTADREYLRKLESLHKSLVLYLWLSFRFTGVFTSRAMASHVKGLVEQNIDKVLTVFSATSNIRQKMKASRERAILQQFKTQIETAGIKVKPMGSETRSDDEVEERIEASVLVPDVDIQEHDQVATAA